VFLIFDFLRVGLEYFDILKCRRRVSNTRRRNILFKATYPGDLGTNVYKSECIDPTWQYSIFTQSQFSPFDLTHRQILVEVQSPQIVTLFESSMTLLNHVKDFPMKIRQQVGIKET